MIRFNVFALLAVVALQACSGGSSSPAPASAVSPAASSTPAAKPKTSVLLTITIPKAHGGAASRHPEYISTNTQSLVVAQLAASAPYKKTGNTVTTNVTPSSPGCSSGANGTTCVVAFAATAGTFNFSIAAYSGTNGSGSLLSENTLTSATLVAGIANDLSVTLNGVIGSLTLPSSVATTVSQPLTVDFSVLDPSGATIIGTGTYDNGPITLTDSAGQLAFDPATFNGPQDGSSFSMQCSGAGSGTIALADATGNLGTIPYDCSEESIALSPGSLDFDALAADASDPTYDQVVTVQDFNSNVQSQTPNLSCTPGQGSSSSTIAAVNAVSSTQYAIRPLDVGTCTFSVTDQFADGTSDSSQTIQIEIHSTTYTVQTRSRNAHPR
jgi:hypothetical protein